MAPSSTKPLLSLALLFVFTLGVRPPALAQEVKTPIQQGHGHAFACTDYAQGKVFVVNAQGKAVWDYPAPSCNDLWVLPNGNLLFNTGHGVREVTRDKQVVFDYEGSPVIRSVKQKDGSIKKIEGPSEIYACQRLSNGNTFVGECNTGRLLQISPEGKIVKELRLLPEGTDGGHTFMRNARLLPNGDYLVTHNGQQVVREYDPSGHVVLEIPAVGGPHSIVRLPNGHTLISCGDRPGGSRIFEADEHGATVWQVTSADLPGIQLYFMAGVARLPNGNTVMCNWLGHGNFGKAPHLIEVTPKKKVVWTFADHKTMRTISNIVILDEAPEAWKDLNGKG